MVALMKTTRDQKKARACDNTGFLEKKSLMTVVHDPTLDGALLSRILLLCNFYFVKRIKKDFALRLKSILNYTFDHHNCSKGNVVTG